MNPFYLILGSEAALADRALNKVLAQLKEEKAEITTIFAGDALLGDIADALAPSLFSERRALIIRDLQDLPDEAKDELTRYWASPMRTQQLSSFIKVALKARRSLMQLRRPSLKQSHVMF